MNKIQTILAGAMLATTVTTATAGGILTNTNQSIDFLRNPAREAAIGLDGVYSNPAGVAFLPEGFHLGVNWQYAHQTRTITSTDDFFALGKKNNGQTTKVYEGVADAPVIPSIQAAYNTGNWSWQFNFSIPGGGGKCEFESGLGSFERKVGEIAATFMNLDRFASTLNGLTGAAITNNGVMGYNMDSYMEGRQYYYGFQLGTAYKVRDNLSVYGGLRLLYGNATYKARISNIQVRTEGGDLDFGTFLPRVSQQVGEIMPVATQVYGMLAQKQAAGMALTAEEAQLAGTIEKLSAMQQSGQLLSLSKYADGVNLLCNQSSVGIAPIIGVDYKLNDKFNFAAKYEFKTQIRMKNESTVFEANEIEAVNKYRDSEEVNEDAPALLAVGAQWSPVSEVRINLGGHYYFDKQADWYSNAQDKLDHNSYEILAGAEWDVTDRFTISAGGQLTRYGLTDDYMNDMSFVVNSYSVGFGGNYKASDRVTVKAGYFQTIYDTYKRTQPTVDEFTRTNRVLGVGCEIAL
ncbi:MAG: TonB-dependent receptor [Prevotella sp.]|nr:TonB-dependent receptor [Prevotella sp.]